MKREVVVEGPSIAEALDVALEELGVQQDSVDYEVLEPEGSDESNFSSERTAFRLRVALTTEFMTEMTAHAGFVADEGGEDGGADLGFSVRHTHPDLTEEELDRVADHAVKVLRALLDSFGLAAEIEEYEGDEGEIILDVVGDDLGILIGRHGRCLDAIQALVAAATSKALGFRYPVVIDVEGYRNRMRAKIEAVAQRSAERAIRSREEVKLRPMTGYERRTVHFALRNNTRVTTVSEGEEPFRAVVIKPN